MTGSPPDTDTATHPLAKQKLWDGWIRFYHWFQVLLFTGLIISGERGAMEWHFGLAYLMLGLWLSRILWGIFGSETARFSQFVKGPRRIISYLRGNSAEHPGHNPLGALMVVFMLGLLGLQLLSGLFNSDYVFADGPLYAYASDAVADTMSWLHFIVGKVLLAAVALHLLAIAVYARRGKSLIKPMLSGFSQLSTAPKLRSGWWGLVLFIVILGLVSLWWLPDLPW